MLWRFVLSAYLRIRMLFIDGVLATGALQFNLNLFRGPINLIIRPKGLIAVGYDLQAHSVSDGNDIENGLAFFVRLQLHVAVVFSVFERMKDNSGTLHRLSV